MGLETHTKNHNTDGLPQDVRKLISDILIDMEPEVYDYYTKVMYSAEAKLAEKGMKIIELPPAEAKKYSYAFTDYTWEKLCKKMPEYGPKMYKICKPYLKRQMVIMLSRLRYNFCEWSR